MFLEHMITVVVPAYNEEDILPDFLAEIAKLADKEKDMEMVVVNDGSRDKTGKILEDARKKYSFLRVVTHEGNKGLGAALATGFKNAKGDVIVTLDADLTHPPFYILELLKYKGPYDCCIASRYVQGGGMKEVPFYRVWLSIFANNLFSFIYRIPVKDITSGFKVYNAAMVRDMEITSKSFSVQLEIMVRLAKQGASFKEIPFVLVNRAKGASKFSFRIIPKYLFVGTKLFLIRWFQ